jgi:hypothetical protein
MGTSNYSDEFKRDAVHPLPDRALRSNVPRGGLPYAGILCGRCPDAWGSASILSTSG